MDMYFFAVLMSRGPGRRLVFQEAVARPDPTHLDGESVKWLSTMVHGREQESEKARELKGR